MTPIVKIRLRRAIYTKNQFEKAAWSEQKIVCGIDEVGRGCLAGPLVAAAAIFPQSLSHTLLRDSKLLTAQQREFMYKWLIKRVRFGIGIVHNRMIDSHNVGQANLLAMKRALMHAMIQCPSTPACILVDAMPLSLSDTSYAHIPVHYFPKGEHISSSIAAASILAKVTRDHIMQRLHHVIPGYCLDEHKGYGTKDHTHAITTRGASIIHRITFLKNIARKDTQYEKQQSLC